MSSQHPNLALLAFYRLYIFIEANKARAVKKGLKVPERFRAPMKPVSMYLRSKLHLLSQYTPSLCYRVGVMCAYAMLVYYFENRRVSLASPKKKNE